MQYKLQQDYDKARRHGYFNQRSLKEVIREVRMYKEDSVAWPLILNGAYRVFIKYFFNIIGIIVYDG